MMTITIPGYRTLDLHHALFDYNGTLAVDGIMAEEIKRGLLRLTEHLTVHIATAGTHGGLEHLKPLTDAGATLDLISPGKEAEQKLALLNNLGSEITVAAGNGANDLLMMMNAALAIGVMSNEGICSTVATAAQLIVPSPAALLEVLLNPKRIIATLRR